MFTEGYKRALCYYEHTDISCDGDSNENANILIRRFITKVADINEKSDMEIKNWINNYPKKIFTYKMANEMCNEISLK